MTHLVVSIDVFGKIMGKNHVYTQFVDLLNFFLNRPKTPKCLTSYQKTSQDVAYLTLRWTTSE